MKMNPLEQYQADLHDLVRGALPPERAREILQAAEHDEPLARAIAHERQLDAWLEQYEVPELPEGFEGRFWQRFQQEKLYGESAGRRWFWKAGGALAACLLLAVGALMFVNFDRDGATPSENRDIATVEEDTQEDTSHGVTDEVLYEWDELDYLAGVEAPRMFRFQLDAESLRLLKALADDDRFAELDALRPGDEGLLRADLELLQQLIEADLEDFEHNGEDE
jgi:hypothetical protein